MAPVRRKKLFPPTLAALKVAQQGTGRCERSRGSPPTATEVVFGQKFNQRPDGTYTGGNKEDLAQPGACNGGQPPRRLT